MNKNILGIDEEVEEIFGNHNWKGNVRELKNVIEGAFNISSGRIIRVKDLPEYLMNPVRLQVMEQSAALADEKILVGGGYSFFRRSCFKLRKGNDQKGAGGYRQHVGGRQDAVHYPAGAAV